MTRKTKRNPSRQTVAPARGAASAARPTDRSGAFVANFVLAAILIVYAIILLRTAWLSDDAYITFRTIDNFVSGYGLRWNVAERVQAFTHPLWLVLLSGIYFVTREIYLTVLITSMMLSLAALALLGWHVRRRNTDPLLLAAGMGVLLMSRAFVDYSTSGLENPLAHLLLVTFVLLFLDDAESARQLFLLSLLTSLGILNRMDTALLFFPPLAWVVWRSRQPRRVIPVLLGMGPFFVWEAFSLVYYGFPFPNTAYAKLRTGVARLDYWKHGLAYFHNSFSRDPITLLAIGGGVIVGLIGPNGKQRALVSGVLLYLAYIVNIGGDFMSGRFFAAPLLVSVMLLLDASFHVQTAWGRRLLPVAVLLVGCIGATPTLLSGKGYGRMRNQLMDEIGVADERGFYYPKTGLLGDTPLAMRPFCDESDQGKKRRRHADPLIVEGAVGFYGFFAGPGAYLMDYHALGDPLLSRLPMVNSDPLFQDFCSMLNGHPCAEPWRIGHYLRNIPDGYIESILAGENHLIDNSLHQFYEPIRLITRAPIWSRQRWLAIIKMNLGLYDSLLGPMKPSDYRPTSFADAYERFPDVRSISLLSGAAKNRMERGMPENAIECYQKLVAIDPTYHEAWNNLGQLLIWRGDLTGGEAALLEAIKLRAGHIEPYRSLGDLMEKTGRGPQALSLFQRLAMDGDTKAAEYLSRKNVPR